MVVLNDKDADFIAKVIRNELEHINKTYEETLSSGKARVNNVLNELETIESEDIFGISKSELKNDILRIQKESIEELNAKVNEFKSNYETCLELLMCGSK